LALKLIAFWNFGQISISLSAESWVLGRRNGEEKSSPARGLSKIGVTTAKDSFFSEPFCSFLADSAGGLNIKIYFMLKTKIKSDNLNWPQT